MRLAAVVTALVMLGLVPIEKILVGALIVGSACGIYALVRVVALESKWEDESRGRLEVADQVRADASEIDGRLRGTDA